MHFLLKNKWVFIGVVLGSVAGWCYWYFVGCASGTCPITSKPVNSTLYGALLGYLAGSMVKENSKRKI